MFPGFIACFRSCNSRHPCPGNPAGVIKCRFASQKQPTDSLFSHSHLMAFSAASLVDLMVLFLAAPSHPDGQELNGFLISSAQGTVSSSMIRCFEDSEMMIMSDQRDVFVMCSGNSCFPRSMCSCNQELCGEAFYGL